MRCESALDKFSRGLAAMTTHHGAPYTAGSLAAGRIVVLVAVPESQPLPEPACTKATRQRGNANSWSIAECARRRHGRRSCCRRPKAHSARRRCEVVGSHARN